MKTTTAVAKYINAIRNADKSRYAREYANFLFAGEPEGKEPERGELSYMAAQGVRMQLRDLVTKENPRAQRYNFPDIKKALAMGKIVAIEYASVRDGKTYRHSFTGSRPHLAVSTDGKQLLILGGGYRVTERGIEDL